MKRKHIFITLFCLFGIANLAYSQPKIIAHRGFWTLNNAPHNSIEALKNTIEYEIWGNEFDVLMSADGKLIVNHDNKIKDLTISKTPYKKLKKITLTNGEKMPLLKDYLKIGKKASSTKLILELKPLSDQEMEKVMVKKIVDLVNKYKLEDGIEYISFSLNMCKELHRLNPKAKISFLGGHLPPSKIKELGLTGLDYHYKVFIKNPHWIKEAHEMGLTVNVWTVNDTDVMNKVLKMNVDYITTDYPDKLLEIINSPK